MPKSKYETGDRVKFVSHGPMLGSTGTVRFARRDGHLIVHFDGHPEDSAVFVDVTDVAPESRAARSRPDPAESRQIEYHLDQIDAWQGGRRGTVGLPSTGGGYPGRMFDEIARHERALVDLGHQPTVDYVRLHGLADGARGPAAPSIPSPTREIERDVHLLRASAESARGRRRSPRPARGERMT